MANFKLSLSRPIFCEPVVFAASEDDSTTTALALGEKLFPAQYSDGRLTALLTLPAGNWELTSAVGDFPETKIVEDTDYLDIFLGGDKFTSYVFSDKLYKPYLGPVLTDFGKSYTRLDFETKEHPHHRSVFFGIGDVSLENGAQNVDFWNEPAACGVELHRGIEKIESGAAYAAFTAKAAWCSHDKAPMLDAECEYKIYSQPSSCRYIDVKLTLTAAYGGVTFGKTKEAGPLGVRVADPLRVDRGGYMNNSYGAVGEAECWGRPAVWCAYGGELEGNKIGIAVFDHAKNERFPTTWHIRDYGLFAANNLYFRGGFSLADGESITYRYRLVFFAGTPDDASIRERYISYSTIKNN